MAQTTTSRRLIAMPLRSESLLLIGDNSQLLTDTAAHLEAKGFDTLVCSCLQQADTLFKQRQPSCIVAEFNFGGDTVFDLLRYLSDTASAAGDSASGDSASGDSASGDSTAGVIVFDGDYTLEDVVRVIKCGAVDCIDAQGAQSKVLKGSNEDSFLRLTQSITSYLSGADSSHVLNGEVENLAGQDITEPCSTDDVLISLNRELRENVQILERDQAAGRLVQQKLSPKTPLSAADLNISYKIYPSLELSGDSIDYGLLGERFLAFYLTDVSGHGAASAFVAVWVKQLVRSLFRDKALFRSRESFENDAPMLMRHINDELIGAGLSQHLTCFVGVIDTQENDMIYVVGGHLPLPILVTGKETKYLHGEGKPLGLFDGADWSIRKLSLPPAYSFIVFSDGVLEVLPGRDLVEKEALLLGSVTAAESISLEGVISTLNLKETSALPDDIAMLLISKTE